MHSKVKHKHSSKLSIEFIFAVVSFNISSDTKIRDLNRQSRVYVSPQISMNGTETDDVVGRQLLVTKDSDNCVKFSAVAKVCLISNKYCIDYLN